VKALSDWATRRYRFSPQRQFDWPAVTSRDATGQREVARGGDGAGGSIDLSTNGRLPTTSAQTGVAEAFHLALPMLSSQSVARTRCAKASGGLS